MQTKALLILHTKQSLIMAPQLNWLLKTKQETSENDRVRMAV